MKRGSFEVLQTTMLFEVIISILVAGILMWALFDFNDVSLMNTNYMSEDIKQIEEFIENMPGDFEIEYPIEGINYKEGKVVEDKYCELKIFKTGEGVSYGC